jgi:peptidoglycan-N-acetylglucosamine deacetylase
MREAFISCDADTLASIYKGRGLAPGGSYRYAEFRIGLENFAAFLERFGIPATVFVVGRDLCHGPNRAHLVDFARRGHEIANHSMNHPQGFCHLSPKEQEREIASMEDLCVEVVGKRPVGFRSPGWNAGRAIAPLLSGRGYLYDSSVFPSLLNPLLKLAHRLSTTALPAPARTTLGPWRNMLAPARPHRLEGPAAASATGLLELPVTVTPVLRLPFFATVHLATGMVPFTTGYAALKAMRRPIHYQFHLSDFVDYTTPEFEDQLPRGGGVYVPQALRTPLREKLALFERIMTRIAADYQFATLETWALRLTRSL